MAQMKVGITVNPTLDAHNAIFSSGIGQNCIYLALCLNQLPNVQVGFVGDTPLCKKFAIDSIALMDCDVVIELGLKLGDVEAQAFKQRGKLISYMAGNTMLMNLEHVASSLPYGEQPTYRYDQVWVTPQHWEMNADYCRLTRGEHVHVIPHIWDSICLRMSAMEFGNTFVWKPSPWRLMNTEANVNCVKTFHLPLMVMEHCERINPSLIDHAYLLNTKHMTGQRHFDEFVDCLDIKAKLSVEDRLPITNVLGKHANAVVAHHWQNWQNYAWWDTLYGGFPLIHNSAYAKMFDAGYYYPDFDVITGGHVLARALESHADNLTNYRNKTNDLLWALSPFNTVVQQAHAELLDAL